MWGHLQDHDAEAATEVLQGLVGLPLAEGVLWCCVCLLCARKAGDLAYRSMCRAMHSGCRQWVCPACILLQCSQRRVESEAHKHT
jgi:hypothetical protein